MTKFKVGDKVVFSNSNTDWIGTTGIVTKLPGPSSRLVAIEWTGGGREPTRDPYFQRNPIMHFLPENLSLAYLGTEELLNDYSID